MEESLVHNLTFLPNVNKYFFDSLDLNDCVRLFRSDKQLRDSLFDQIVYLYYLLSNKLKFLEAAMAFIQSSSMKKLKYLYIEVERKENKTDSPLLLLNFPISNFPELAIISFENMHKLRAFSIGSVNLTEATIKKCSGLQYPLFCSPKLSKVSLVESLPNMQAFFGCLALSPSLTSLTLDKVTVLQELVPIMFVGLNSLKDLNIQKLKIQPAYSSIIISISSPCIENLTISLPDQSTTKTVRILHSRSLISIVTHYATAVEFEDQKGELSFPALTLMDLILPHEQLIQIGQRLSSSSNLLPLLTSLALSTRLDELPPEGITFPKAWNFTLFPNLSKMKLQYYSNVHPLDSLIFQNLLALETLLTNTKSLELVYLPKLKCLHLWTSSLNNQQLSSLIISPKVFNNLQQLSLGDDLVGSYISTNLQSSIDSNEEWSNFTVLRLPVVPTSTSAHPFQFEKIVKILGKALKLSSLGLEFLPPLNQRDYFRLFPTLRPISTLKRLTLNHVSGPYVLAIGGLAALERLVVNRSRCPSICISDLPQLQSFTCSKTSSVDESGSFSLSVSGLLRLETIDLSEAELKSSPGAGSVLIILDNLPKLIVFKMVKGGWVPRIALESNGVSCAELDEVLAAQAQHALAN